MTCIGIDPSPSTGIVAIIPPNVVKPRRLHLEGVSGIHRVHLIAQGFEAFLDEVGATSENAIACIEGFGFASFNLVLTVQIATGIQLSLCRRKIKCYAIGPSALKKRTTGKGNSDKKEMGVAVKQKWGFSSAYNDVVDAFALAKVAEEITKTTVLPTGVTHETY